MKSFSSSTIQRLGITFTVFVLMLAAAPVAHAQGWMAGGSAGVAKQFDYEVGGPIDNRDDTDTGFRAFGGYIFTPNTAIAVSYVDLGELNYSGSAFDGFTDRLSAEGVDLSFIGAVAPGQQNRVRLFATVGLFRWQQDVDYRDPSGIYQYEDKGTSLSYSGGVEISVGAGAHWGLHVDWQRFKDVGDENNSGHEYDRELISVGAHYRFGK